MSPSYPNWEWETDLSIRFTAPSKRVVCKILEDSEEEEFLRKKAAGTVLYHRVKKLAKTLSRHRIQVDSVKRNELEIILFLPPPPCPPPGLKRAIKRKPFAYKPQLATIEEVPEEQDMGEDSPSSGWITLYEYLPVGKRYAMYADF